MFQTLGQKFDAATGKVNDCYTAAHWALFTLTEAMMSHAGIPDNDFNVQFKANKEDPRLPDTDGSIGRSANNEAFTNTLQGIRNIRFISLERDGVTHDFPMRVEFSYDIMADIFQGKQIQRPVLIVEGLDGRERAYMSRAHYKDLETKNAGSVERVARFLTGQLQKKAVAAIKVAPKYNVCAA